MLPTLFVLLFVAVGFGVLFALVRSREMERWIVPYLAQVPKHRRAAAARGDVHLLIGIVDHYEPGHDATSPEHAQSRVDRWVEEYPKLFGRFRDRDDRPPRHTFCYPIEQYVPGHLDALASLCRAGFGEVEIHLHHDRDTSANLRKTLNEAKAIFSDRHGLLSRRRSGEVAYGFVHGNWCLDNSRPDGRWCGVNDEIDVLVETGCYADFTMPSGGPCQTRTINAIYYAIDDPERPFSHDQGPRVGSGTPPDSGLMMIPGPLVLNWRNRKWGLFPRIEDGCVQASQPATIERVDDWIRAGVSVPNRPDWIFVKLHTHGAYEAGQAALLGPTMVAFHEALAARTASDSRFHVHYVTAREMYNLAKAAEAGFAGSVAEARDYELIWHGGFSTETSTESVADRRSESGGLP